MRDLMDLARAGKRGVCGDEDDAEEGRSEMDDGQVERPEQREVEAPVLWVRLHVGFRPTGPQALLRVLGEEAGDEVPRVDLRPTSGGSGEREQVCPCRSSYRNMSSAHQLWIQGYSSLCVQKVLLISRWIQTGLD